MPQCGAAATEAEAADEVVPTLLAAAAAMSLAAVEAANEAAFAAATAAEAEAAAAAAAFEAFEAAAAERAVAASAASRVDLEEVGLEVGEASTVDPAKLPRANPLLIRGNIRG